MQCISICDADLELDYQVLATGSYNITIISSLGERYVANVAFVAGDDLTISPMPPLNEYMNFRAIVSTGDAVETTLYFRTYPYELFLS